MAKEVANVFLRLPNGKYVFQRRDKLPWWKKLLGKSFSNPNKLGLFGGHLDQAESALKAMHRELAEETSLVFNKADLKFIFDFIPEVGQFKAESAKKYHIFLLHIKSSKFKACEGQRNEEHDKSDVLKRSDLIESVRFFLENNMDEKS